VKRDHVRTFSELLSLAEAEREMDELRAEDAEHEWHIPGVGTYYRRPPFLTKDEARALHRAARLN
jgi:hypothetical protein